FTPHTITRRGPPSSTPPPAESRRVPSGLKRTWITHSGASSTLSTVRFLPSQSVIPALLPDVASTAPSGDPSTAYSSPSTRFASRSNLPVATSHSRRLPST